MCGIECDQVRAELSLIRAGTDKPYNVNFFCHSPPQPDLRREEEWRRRLSPYYEEYGLPAGPPSGASGRTPFNAETAELLEEFKPPVVSFHFGLPFESLMLRVKALGATVLSSATTVAEPRCPEDRGVDMIISQGLEAGGHRGMFLSEDRKRASNPCD